ncbi:hypothetical protein [Luteibacter sp. UNCMF366Tsu5.1]|uniref:hypothetical protein n=1 Tax=Luteibacter sp. UNCMF366Tsu5.1 TaxID=1502758 RepID=UPI000908EC10|nr:hypothetical protein [Luteibacter sp. UNCMF366Tsu5.1]SFW27739.1 hypothetical protein SAMN02800691_0719 [Luteibacter sp. UNCMF366Tsu5.1]
MHMWLRVVPVREDAFRQLLKSREARIAELLLLPPGTSEAEAVERHPKGGNRVRVESSPDAIYKFIAYLHGNDWISMI